MRVANRLGAEGEGIDILAWLSESERDQMIAQERVGSLSERSIEDVRLRYAVRHGAA